MKVLEGEVLVPDISIAPDYSTLNKDKTSKKQSRGQSSGDGKETIINCERFFSMAKPNARRGERAVTQVRQTLVQF
jgi:hypothetical protein